jgi:hypothetical protein
MPRPDEMFVEVEDGGDVTVAVAATDAELAEERAIALQDVAAAKSRFTEAAKLALAGDPQAPELTREAMRALEEARSWFGAVEHAIAARRFARRT